MIGFDSKTPLSEPNPFCHIWVSSISFFSISKSRTSHHGMPVARTTTESCTNYGVLRGARNRDRRRRWDSMRWLLVTVDGPAVQSLRCVYGRIVVRLSPCSKSVQRLQVMHNFVVVHVCDFPFSRLSESSALLASPVRTSLPRPGIVYGILWQLEGVLLLLYITCRYDMSFFLHAGRS